MHTNSKSMLRLYTFSSPMESTLAGFLFRLTIHANIRATDSGATTKEYPPYLIKGASEYDAAINNPVMSKYLVSAGEIHGWE